MPKTAQTKPAQMKPHFSPEYLPVVIYLNQRSVFDLLATLEGGFTQLETVQAAGAKSAEQGATGQASLGIANVFAFLGVSLGATGHKQSGQSDTTTVSTERVHTPASLFARLRSHLIEASMLKNVTDHESLTQITPGDFVEFTAALQRNPLVDTVRGLIQLITLASAFSTEPATQGKKGQPHTADPNKKLAMQAQSILDVLTSEGSVDLLGKLVTSTEVRAVLVADMNYFADPTLNDTIDGEFRVLGKVTRVLVPGSEESINLLRKTGLGIFQAEALKEMLSAFANLQGGLKPVDVATQITAPALQVIPLAIFA